ncbi:MAG: hypothetical protein HY282_03510 [Nitrospirae bacterium]|nr:hypothetical protein [Candidatus Manganitrophaceae bacterium]
MLKTVPISLKEGRLVGEVNAEYEDPSFRHFLDRLPEAIAENRYPLLHAREDRLYLVIEIERSGRKEPLFVKVDDFTRRVRFKKWIRNRFVRSRARKSWRAGEALMKASLPTPTPIAFLERRLCGFLLQSYLLVEQIPSAEAVHQRYARLYEGCADGVRLREKEDLLQTLAGALATLHGAGMFYGDLKASNVLVYPAEGKVHLTFVDLESVRISREISLARRIEDLGSLLSSFLGIVSRRDAVRFLQRYLAAASNLKVDRKVFFRNIYQHAIQRKGRGPASA